MEWSSTKFNSKWGGAFFHKRVAWDEEKLFSAEVENDDKSYNLDGAVGDPSVASAKALAFSIELWIASNYN